MQRRSVLRTHILGQRRRKGPDRHRRPGCIGASVRWHRGHPPRISTPGAADAVNPSLPSPAPQRRPHRVQGLGPVPSSSASPPGPSDGALGRGVTPFTPSCRVGATGPSKGGCQAPLTRQSLTSPALAVGRRQWALCLQQGTLGTHRKTRWPLPAHCVPGAPQTLTKPYTEMPTRGKAPGERPALGGSAWLPMARWPDDIATCSQRTGPPLGPEQLGLQKPVRGQSLSPSKKHVCHQRCPAPGPEETLGPWAKRGNKG